jgi:macrolide transport system ATP-binding/permease protein
MRRLRAVLLRLAGLFQKERRDRELAEEIESHLQMHFEDRLRAGLSPGDARRDALLRLGGVEALKEAHRDRRGAPVVENLARDLGYAVRTLRRSPGFTAVAVLALALGIGANTTAFTALDAVALRPRPVQDPDRLARVYRSTPADACGPMSYPDYADYRDRSRVFSDLSMLAFGMAIASSDLSAESAPVAPRLAGTIGFRLPQLLEGSARPLGSAFVSGNYFRMLGAVPARGRLLRPEDDTIGAPPVAVMGGNFWQRQLGSDPAIVGSTLHLNGVPFTVVGVTPLDYIGTAQSVPELWIPISAKPRLGMTRAQLEDRRAMAGWVEGRLRPGASLADARAELDVLAARLRADDPQADGHSGVTVTSGRAYAPPFDAATWGVIATTMAAVALLLLIACANVACLLLARAAVRRKEIAVRLSLGATRARLIQQLLTESALIGLLAGALGLPLAWAMMRLLIVEVSSALPSYWGAIALQIDPDVRIFAYTLLVSLATGVVFGLAPAWQASPPDLNAALKDEGRALGRAPGRSRLRDVLIAAQIGACLVLLIGSALLLRGSQRALRAEPGFDTRHVVIIEVFDPARASRGPARWRGLKRELKEAVGAVPGVSGVAVASRPPIGGGQRWVAVAEAGAPAPPAGEGDPPAIGYSYVSPNYFETLGIGVVRGRTFIATDAEAALPVAIVSEATARRFWPGEDAVGKRLAIGRPGAGHFAGEEAPLCASCEVVGVVRDVHGLQLHKPDDAFLYLPLPETRPGSVTLLVRTEGDPASRLPSLGRAVRSVGPGLPAVAGVLDTMISFDPHFVVARMGGMLSSLIGVLGLLLACLGVYGMVAYCAARRTQEIGIRVALGARRTQVLGLVMREGMRPVLAGVATGVVASAAVGRVLSAMLFGLSSLDVVSFAGVSALLFAIALLATWLPARRAARVDPMVALRYE